MRKIPERYDWAVSMLEIAPNEQLLEIGCSTGVLGGMIAEKLRSGRLTAIDRSEAQIEKARKSNSALIEKGLVEYHTCDFFSFEHSEKFDKIFAFNVNIFSKKSKQTLSRIKEMLKTNGRLYIFRQDPFEVDIASMNPIRDALINSEYQVEKTLLQVMNPYSSTCVIARI